MYDRNSAFVVGNPEKRRNSRQKWIQNHLRETDFRPLLFGIVPVVGGTVHSAGWSTHRDVKDVWADVVDRNAFIGIAATDVRGKNDNDNNYWILFLDILEL